MQFCQSAGIVEADARAPVYDGLGLVVELVVALEYVFQLVLGDALPRIGHADPNLFVCHIERYVYPPSCRSELQCV